jgi:hypothetical protein
MNRRLFLSALSTAPVALLLPSPASACRCRRRRCQCCAPAQSFDPYAARAGLLGRGTRPRYSSLDSNYSMDFHTCPDISTSPNQCAVRLSRALIAAGVPMDSDYPGNLCRHGYARGAQDLAAFLRIKWGTWEQGFAAPGSTPAGIVNKKGVLLFANIPNFDGQGHIDLWDGSRTKTPGGEYWTANPIWFWELT